jgi:hypothetical protein
MRRRLPQVAVLGGGLMGSGIATACVLAGMDVVLKEVNQQFLEVGGQACGGGGSMEQGCPGRPPACPGASLLSRVDVLTWTNGPGKLPCKEGGRAVGGWGGAALALAHGHGVTCALRPEGRPQGQRPAARRCPWRAAGPHPL